MTYIECPTMYRPAPGDPPAVFLAGGIVGCPDWQSVAAKHLAERAVVLNPRRANFPIHDPSATPEQIQWEHHHLHMDGVLTLFWFPASDRQVTTQPIAMFELGAALGEQRPIVVGADPGYPRAADVRWQTALARPELTVTDSLDALLASVTDQLAPAAR